MLDSQRQTIQRYLNLRQTNALAHATRTAVATGIIHQLRQRQHTVEQLSQACGLQPIPLGLLLTVLQEVGLVERYGDDYALSQAGKLLPESLEDLGDRYWQHLEHWLRAGEAVPENPHSDLDATDLWSEQNTHNWLATPAALDATQALDVGQSRQGLQVLCLFAGTSVTALSLLHRDPTSRATLVDFPNPLLRAREQAATIDQQDRIQWIEGDPATVRLAEPQFDLVLIERVIHQLSPTQRRQTLETAFAALTPAGEIAILDVFPGQEQGNLTRAILDLEVALRSDGHPPVSPLTLQNELTDIGFSHVQFAHLPATPHVFGLLLASKPLEQPALELTVDPATD